MMKNSSQKTYCSAGVSHFAIYPNGDVYRCVAKYYAGNSPLCNLKRDGLTLLPEALECINPNCISGCDGNWTTKWLINKFTNKIEKKVVAEITKTAPEVKIIRDWAKQTYSDNLLIRKAHILWNITLRCNYDCLYCSFGLDNNKIFKEFPSAQPELEQNQWVETFKKHILPRFDWAFITVSGGEPLITPGLFPVLKIAARKFGFVIITNLSRPITRLIKEKIPFLDYRSWKGVSFIFSLHPKARNFNFEQFLNRVLVLKENGYPGEVQLVNHPKQMDLISHYQKILNEHKVKFAVTSWDGKDNTNSQISFLHTKNI